MKFKAILALACLLAVGTTTVRAENDTPLGKEMSGMNKSLRTLKRQVTDPAKKADSLALVTKIKGHLAEAVKLEPAKTKDVPAADKAAYVVKYKEQMDGLVKSFDTIEVALKADKFDEAKAVFEKLSEQKEKGHKDFGADDDK